MSWLDIFKKKPRAPRAPYGVAIVNDVPPQTGNPTVPFITQITGNKPGQGKKTYTAKEVAEAGISGSEVEEIVQEITRQCYEAALQGDESIGYSHKNSNLLNHLAKELTQMGYEVNFLSGSGPISSRITVSWIYP